MISNVCWEWNLQWRRFLFEVEKEMVAKFMDEIDDLMVHTHQSDNWVWKGDSSGTYIVENAYMLLDKGFDR